MLKTHTIWNQKKLRAILEHPDNYNVFAPQHRDSITFSSEFNSSARSEDHYETTLIHLIHKILKKEIETKNP